MQEDVKKLIDIWEQLHKIGGELKDIEDRHPEVKDIHDVIQQAISRLSEASHIIFREAHEIKRKEQDNENNK